MKSPHAKNPPPPSLPWEKNAIRWTPDESTFPLSYLSKPRLAHAAAWTLTGIGAAALPLSAAVKQMAEQGFRWAPLLMMVPFLTAGILLFLYGVSRFYARRIYTLRKEEVECDWVRLVQRYHWKESVRRYEGTLKEIKYYGGGGAGASRIYYRVVLKHPDPEKTVVLFECHSWGPVDEAWRRFARLFAVPALDQTPSGIVKLSPRDLEGQPKAKDTDAWMDPGSLKLSGRVSLSRSGGRFQMRFREPLASLPRLMAAALWGGATWYFHSKGLVPGAVVTGAFGILALVLAVSKLRTMEVVTLEASGVEHHRETPFGPRPVTQVPAEILTNVLVDRGRVVFRGRGQSLSFGSSLSRTDREQIRDFAILVLSNGPSRLDLAS